MSAAVCAVAAPARPVRTTAACAQSAHEPRTAARAHPTAQIARDLPAVAHPRPAAQHAHDLPQRAALGIAVWALAAALGGSPAAAAAVEPVYFGNGCFWGRQYDFVRAEQTALGRRAGEVSAVAGYAGGKLRSPSDKVCYYYTPEKDTVYERLGHAEVVQVELRGQSPEEQRAQFRALADTYFSQFRRLPGGAMIRQDPQDAGPGYRNVVGIPGGIASPLFEVLAAANVHGMRLVAGEGGAFTPDGKPTEGDELNVVWVVDSTALPFNSAEQYHQYHQGLGKTFPTQYTRDMKRAAVETGRVASTGCPEYFFLGS